MEKIKVLYDAQAFEFQTHGGVSRSFSELITHFPTIIDPILAIKESDNIYIKEYSLETTSPLYRTYDSFLNGVKFKGKGHLFNALSFFLSFIILLK